MTFDLVVRGGVIVDGSGGELYAADIGVVGNRIAQIAKNLSKGVEEIDARDRTVTPGFVDVHTHYDGQAIWSDRLSPSSSHGVTAAIVGNCGVGFAPCRQQDHDLLLKLMEGVEDIPEAVMANGLPWTWETFPEYLRALQSRARDIDLGAYLPHSPLRVYVMGERGARGEKATDEDLKKMRALVKEALRAGAFGFSTSRLSAHRTADAKQIPSFEAHISELKAIASELAMEGIGTWQMVLNTPYAAWEGEFEHLSAIAESCKRPVTFSLVMGNGPSEEWAGLISALDAANNRGLRISAQVLPRPIGVLSGLELSINPFVQCPSYKTIAHLDFEQRLAAMRTTEIRRRLLEETPEAGHPMVMLGRTWKWMYPMSDPPNYAPSRAESVWHLAAVAGSTPEEWAYDYLTAGDGRSMLFGAMANFPTGKLDAIELLLKHPNCIVGLGDGGAHYGAICDASFPTYLLTEWVKKSARLTLPEAINMLARKPALAVGLPDRGLIRVGTKADLNVLDIDKLHLPIPTVVYDLPAQGRRLDQSARGYDATIVSGQIIRRLDQPTGHRPGGLIRSATH